MRGAFSRLSTCSPGAPAPRARPWCCSRPWRRAFRSSRRRSAACPMSSRQRKRHSFGRGTRRSSRSRFARSITAPTSRTAGRPPRAFALRRRSALLPGWSAIRPSTDPWRDAAPSRPRRAGRRTRPLHVPRVSRDPQAPQPVPAPGGTGAAAGLAAGQHHGSGLQRGGRHRGHARAHPRGRLSGRSTSDPRGVGRVDRWHARDRRAVRAVGVASGRDVSVTNLESPANAGERAYVGYEMWVRDLETAVDGIVGASGCLYAIRANLHMHDVPEALSRDFAAALTARAHGQRAVSVPAAICYVPRGASLHQEYARKVRTITRGLGTLLYKRALLNPLRTGLFAWMLFSHKVCRWLLPWALLLFVAALATLAVTSSWARAALVAAAAVGVLAAAGWRWSERGRIPPPRLVTLAAYLVAGNVAVLHAWLRVVGGRLAPVWEPTRR